MGSIIQNTISQTQTLGAQPKLALTRIRNFPVILPPEKEQEKIQYGLLLLKTLDRLPKKSIKLIRDGLYELRTEYGGNIFRVFFIFDEGKVVVLFNGFQKKSQKTPLNEIEKALKIKEAYYADKQSSNSRLRQSP